MDAPTYPAATRYDEPLSAGNPLSVSTVSLAELMSAPLAWAIVLKHAPVLKQIVSGPLIQPFLTNMMVESFLVYGGMVSQAQVAAIDAELRQLPSGEGPKL